MQLVPVTQMLKAAEKGGYGIGSFSARNTYLIDAVLKGAQETKAPVIVQISANEFNWFDVTAKEFADRFYEVHGRYQGQAALHLDHTKDMDIIKAAIDAGFQSVMIDASQKSFEDNIAITREVVEYAHAKNVEVEAELGKIGATDKSKLTMMKACIPIPRRRKSLRQEPALIRWQFPSAQPTGYIR